MVMGCIEEGERTLRASLHISHALVIARMPVQTVGTRSSSPPHQLIPEQPGNEASMHTHIHIHSAVACRCTYSMYTLTYIHTHTHFGITLQFLTGNQAKYKGYHKKTNNLLGIVSHMTKAA